MKINTKKGLRAVAIFEAAKGMLVLMAGIGALALLGRDVQVVAEELVKRSHVNPASKYPHIFIDLADKVTDTHLWGFAIAAAFYATVRFVEAYGLWRERTWAEWFALLSGAMYLPIEVFELWDGVTKAKIVVTVINVAIVGYVGFALWNAKKNGDK